MHLKHGLIRFGCTKQLSLLVALGCAGFGSVGSKFFNFNGLGYVSQLMGWVGSGHTKLTHG